MTRSHLMAEIGVMWRREAYAPLSARDQRRLARLWRSWSACNE
jgi:hypothetical protein